MDANTPHNRLLQICDELKSEGYRITGSLGSSVYALKHTNGNRITLIEAEGRIATIKNGRMVKIEPIIYGSNQSCHPVTK